MDAVVSEHPDAFAFMDYRHSAQRAPAGNDGEYFDSMDRNLP
jgi:hypothetical protein